MNFKLKSSYLWIALLASYLFIVVGLAIQLQDGLGFISFKSPVRYFYDAYDVRVYFASSNWLGDLSRLYVSVPSEYPLAANYIFLAARNISEILPGSIDEFRRFQIVWTAMAAFMYCACLCVVRSLPDQKNIRLVIWLSPAIVYYSLFRFDIYVALPLMAFMLLVMRERFWLGSLLVGVAIALKGFAVVVLPALFFFIFARKGFGIAIACVLLSLAPFAICNLLVYSNTGLEGLVFPYRFHAIRSFNGQSTWDAFSIQYLVNEISILPSLVIAICSLYAVWKRPKSFEEFTDCSVVAITGFASSLVFYSPQFVLWIVASSVFSSKNLLQYLGLSLSVFTYAYFPYMADLVHAYPSQLGRDVLLFFVRACSVVRLAMIGICVAPQKSLRP